MQLVRLNVLGLDYYRAQYQDSLRCTLGGLALDWLAAVFVGEPVLYLGEFITYRGNQLPLPVYLGGAFVVYRSNSGLFGATFYHKAEAAPIARTHRRYSKTKTDRPNLLRRGRSVQWCRNHGVSCLYLCSCFACVSRYYFCVALNLRRLA